MRVSTLQHIPIAQNQVAQAAEHLSQSRIHSGYRLILKVFSLRVEMATCRVMVLVLIPSASPQNQLAGCV